MNNTLVKQKRFAETLSMIAVVMIGAIFVILTIAAILQTSRIDPQNIYSEKILFEDDFIPVNLGLIAITMLAFIAVRRRDIHLGKTDTRFVVFVMLIVTTILPIVWINLVQSVATGDQRFLLDTAKDAAQGNYRELTDGYYSNFSYYQYYPSQLGYVFFAEIFYRIFGSGISDLFFQIPNVIALDFVYVGLVMITQRILRRRSVTNMTAIVLTICLQPIFMTTYTSPIFIGLAFAVWSVFFTVRYIQDNKLWHAGIAALLITFAVVLRYNYAIILAAICIALILHTVGSKRFLALAAAAVMIVCSFGAQKLLIYSYGERSGMEFDTEVSPVETAYLGISESSMAPGWFNWNALTTLRDTWVDSEDHRMDQAAADEAAREGIERRVAELNREGQLTDFYKKKFLSQFNEPAFESVWVSRTRGHDIAADEPLPSVVTSIYTGGFSLLLDRWFPYFDMIIYLGFAAGTVWMLIRRRLEPETIILPTAVLGAIIYHMICEAKSQFFLPYFILLIPFAMYGLLETTTILKDKTDLLFRKQKDSEPA